MKRRYLLFLVCCCTSLIGCKSLDWNKTETEAVAEEAPWWKQDDLPPVNTPTKVVAFWANSVFNEAGAPPIRGLGGRVYFYDNKHQTVRVDGKLSVFIYDDTDENAREQQEATKQVNFTATEVASKYSPTEFGPSYSFWLPWDEVGGERAQLSVIPVFTSSDGQMLHGAQARCLLPGSTPKVLAKKDSGRRGGVVAASFETGSEDTSDSPALEFTTTTIKVPQAVQRRLRAPSQPRVQSIRTRQSNPESSPRMTELPRSTSPNPTLNKPNAFANNRKPFDANFGRGTMLEPVPTAKVGEKKEADEPTVSGQPSADFLPDPHQVQALQSAQQASAPAPSALDRARSLFDR